MLLDFVVKGGTKIVTDISDSRAKSSLCRLNLNFIFSKRLRNFRKFWKVIPHAPGNEINKMPNTPNLEE